ncbi:MAG: hypothetical protein HYS98_04775 [Deltaproteobacteria bacterium]|nr:hypothetical protein [Deltaproteobacteria bacterium]
MLIIIAGIILHHLPASLAIADPQFIINPYLVVKPINWAVNMEAKITNATTDKELHEIWRSLLNKYEYYLKYKKLTMLSQCSRHEWKQTRLVLLEFLSKTYLKLSKVGQASLSKEAHVLYYSLIQVSEFGLRDLSQKLYPYMVTAEGFSLFKKLTLLYYEATPENESEEIEYREDLSYLIALWADMLFHSKSLNVADNEILQIRGYIHAAQKYVDQNASEDPIFFSQNNSTDTVDRISFIESIMNVHIADLGSILWGHYLIGFFCDCDKLMLNVNRVTTAQELKLLSLGELRTRGSDVHSLPDLYVKKDSSFFLFLQGIAVELSFNLELIQIIARSSSDRFLNNRLHKVQRFNSDPVAQDQYIVRLIVQALNNKAGEVLTCFESMTRLRKDFFSIWIKKLPKDLFSDLIQSLCENLKTDDSRSNRLHVVQILGSIFSCGSFHTPRMPLPVAQLLYNTYMEDKEEQVRNQALNVISRFLGMSPDVGFEYFAFLNRDACDIILDGNSEAAYFLFQFNNIGVFERKKKNDIIEEGCFTADINYRGKPFQGAVSFQKVSLDKKEVWRIQSTIDGLEFDGKWKVKNYGEPCVNLTILVAQVSMHGEKCFFIGVVDGYLDIDIKGYIVTEEQYEQFNVHNFSKNKFIGYFHFDD